MIIAIIAFVVVSAICLVLAYIHDERYNNEIARQCPNSCYDKSYNQCSGGDWFAICHKYRIKLKASDILTAYRCEACLQNSKKVKP